MQSLVPIVWAIFVLTCGIDAFSNTDIPLEQWRHWAANKADVKQEYIEWKKSEAGKHAMENELWGDSKHPNDPEATLKERVRRFYLSKLRVEELQRQNPGANLTIDTPFAIMNPQEFEEFVSQSFGELKQDFEEADKARRFRRDLSQEVNAAAPASKDWTTSGCVSSVKTQGNCGACYAIAALGALESAYCIKNKVLPSFSAEQVVGCSKNMKCVGGTRENAFQYVIEKGGLCRTDVSRDWTTTQNPKCVEKCDKDRFDISIKKVQFVDRTDDALLKAIDRQPVTLLVGTSEVWMYYKSGIISNCPQIQNKYHSVLAVGYGTESMNSFGRRSERYLKIKNSWGPGWGENGYIRLQLGNGLGGTCSYLNFPMIYPEL